MGGEKTFGQGDRALELWAFVQSETCRLRRKTMASAEHDVTELLHEWSEGNQQALAELLPIIYDELRRLAHLYLRRENSEHTLQTTALVHEAYLKLVNQKSVNWQNRSHFFGIAAQAMRRILIDNARRRAAAKRAPGEAITFDEAHLGSQKKR